MRHKFLVLAVKKWLKSVYIYGSYHKIKTGVPLFWTTRYIAAVESFCLSRCVRFETNDAHYAYRSAWNSRPTGRG